MLKGDVLFVAGPLRRGSYSIALLREAANARGRHACRATR
jgi:hypothetical protein